MPSDDTKSGSPAVSPENFGDADLTSAADTILSLLADDGDEEKPSETPDDADKSDEEPAESEGEEPAGDPDDASEDEATDEPEKQAQEPSYTVKVDGEELTVPLSELLSGYQRQADYTRKTTAVAEERRKIADDARAKADAHAQEVGRLAQFAQMVLATDPVLAEASKMDQTAWAKLAQEDPIAYTQKRAAVEQRLAAVDAIQREHQRVLEDGRKAHFAEEVEKAKAVIPALADEAKAKEFKKSSREYLTGKGFNETEINGIGDHRILAVLDDALSYRKLLAEKKTAREKKVDTATTTVKPNTAERTEKQDKKLDAKAQRRLRGLSIEAQADAIASLI